MIKRIGYVVLTLVTLCAIAISGYAYFVIGDTGAALYILGLGLFSKLLEIQYIKKE